MCINCCFTFIYSVRDIEPFTEYVTACNLEKSFIFEKIVATSTVVFHRSRIYRNAPRNGQSWHFRSPKICHIVPVWLRNNRCRADRINEPHEKNYLIESKEFHIRYRSQEQMKPKRKSHFTPFYSSNLFPVALK